MTGAAIAKRVLFRTGVFAAMRRLRQSTDLAILRYHAVCGPEGERYASPGIRVSPAAFEAQVAYLTRHCSVVSLPDALRVLRHGGALPPTAVAFTFDDGYADNLEAARTLHRYGVSGTFYITAGCLAGGEPFWPAELRTLVARQPGPCIRLDVNGLEVRLPCGGEHREWAIGRLSSLFKSQPIRVREQLREQLRAAAGYPDVPSAMLTWAQLAEMRDLGMTIGAHTMTHPNLPSAGETDARAEIVESKARLERELGIEVSLFSYPNGGAERYYTPALQEIVREAGFTAAATSSSGFAGPRSDFYALRRFRVTDRLDEIVCEIESARFAARRE